MKYWEIIADNLSKAGWSWSCVSAIDSHGRTIWIADAHRAAGAGPPMLNSARRHCTSPRRGRRVEWSDQRTGNVRLHFWARRSRRRRASDAGYESVGNAGSIDVTTSDIPLRTDSVKRCKG